MSSEATCGYCRRDHTCEAQDPATGYVCTRESGHAGEHVACAGIQHDIVRFGAQPGDGWTSVDVAMPDSETNVLVTLEDSSRGVREVSAGYHHEEQWRTDRPFDRGWRVTHWMDMPEPAGKEGT